MPLALITGASTGIGRATAVRLAEAGWTVLAGVRGLAAAEGLGDGIIVLKLDVTDGEHIAAAAAAVRERSGDAADGSGSLDALVNNAGVGFGGPLEIVSSEDLL